MTIAEANRSHDARDAWSRKPSLRAVYTDLYQRIAARCVPGVILEVGGGSGNFKDYAPDTISTDIVAAPWLDAVADASRLPFADGVISNIVLFDVLHHIEFPVQFLDEAARVLRPGGRIIFSEPAITPVSNLFYTHLHPEPVDMKANIFAVGEPDPNRDPFDSNQAVPTLMMHHQRDQFEARFPGLRIYENQLTSLLAYPMTGGFRPWTMIPAAMVPLVLGLERILIPILGPLMAFRILSVIERRS
ncbi:MAG: class I SAM-dependent methyltransferase [Alphaproteobacteria bacterium]|nr:class I SAM-dependent methyltransferase [Alphaproteobacteria bacterium]